MDELQILERRLREKADRLEKELAETQDELKSVERVRRLLGQQPKPMDSAQAHPNRYASMTQEQAIEDALEREGRLMTAGEVAAILTRDGFPFKTQYPKDTVYQALKQNRLGRFGDATKRGSETVFGLAKWHEAVPARSAS